MPKIILAPLRFSNMPPPQCHPMPRKHLFRNPPQHSWDALGMVLWRLAAEVLAWATDTCWQVPVVLISKISRIVYICQLLNHLTDPISLFVKPMFSSCHASGGILRVFICNPTILCSETWDLRMTMTMFLRTLPYWISTKPCQFL